MERRWILLGCVLLGLALFAPRISADTCVGMDSMRFLPLWLTSKKERKKEGRKERKKEREGNSFEYAPFSAVQTAPRKTTLTPGLQRCPDDFLEPSQLLLLRRAIRRILVGHSARRRDVWKPDLRGSVYCCERYVPCCQRGLRRRKTVKRLSTCPVLV